MIDKRYDILKSLAKKQMIFQCEDFSNQDDFLSYQYPAPFSWDCDVCDWQEYIGVYRRHEHWRD